VNLHNAYVDFKTSKDGYLIPVKQNKPKLCPLMSARHSLSLANPASGFSRRRRFDYDAAAANKRAYRAIIYIQHK